jgi:hypothetical protein
VYLQADNPVEKEVRPAHKDSTITAPARQLIDHLNINLSKEEKMFTARKKGSFLSLFSVLIALSLILGACAHRRHQLRLCGHLNPLTPAGTYTGAAGH